MRSQSYLLGTQKESCNTPPCPLRPFNLRTTNHQLRQGLAQREMTPSCRVGLSSLPKQSRTSGLVSWKITTKEQLAGQEIATMEHSRRDPDHIRIALVRGMSQAVA